MTWLEEQFTLPRFVLLAFVLVALTVVAMMIAPYPAAAPTPTSWRIGDGDTVVVTPQAVTP